MFTYHFYHLLLQRWLLEGAAKGDSLLFFFSGELASDKISRTAMLAAAISTGTLISL